MRLWREERGEVQAGAEAGPGSPENSILWKSGSEMK